MSKLKCNCVGVCWQYSAHNAARRGCSPATRGSSSGFSLLHADGLADQHSWGEITGQGLYRVPSQAVPKWAFLFVFLKVMCRRACLGISNIGTSPPPLLFDSSICDNFYGCISCSTASMLACSVNLQLRTCIIPAGCPIFWDAVHNPSLDQLSALPCSYSICRTAWVFQKKKNPKARPLLKWV